MASLDGAGAAHFGGRWNPEGIPLLYTASSLEGALLEQLARAGVGRLPLHHVAARIALPPHTEVPSLDEVDHPDWHLEPTSRRIGEGWVASASSLALVVPSFVARPWGRTVLINPAHPALAGVQVSEVVDVTWDPRLASSAAATCVPQLRLVVVAGVPVQRGEQLHVPGHVSRTVGPQAGGNHGRMDLAPVSGDG